MSRKIYFVNKGINKSIVFRGLKAQYIWYMGGAMVGLLIVYSVMYLLKINTFISLGVTICLGAAVMMFIYHLSGTYGEHGLSKALASRGIPRIVKARSRKVFTSQSTTNSQNQIRGKAIPV